MGERRNCGVHYFFLLYCYAVGGFLSDENNSLCCSLVNFIKANSQAEAEVIALTESIQFVSQEAEIMESDLNITSCSWF